MSSKIEVTCRFYAFCCLFLLFISLVLGLFLYLILGIIYLVQDYDIVFTNDSETKHVIEKEGVKVSKIPFKNRKVLAGTQIRKRIASKKDWNNLVPNVVYEYINEINGQERMTVKIHKT